MAYPLERWEVEVETIDGAKPLSLHELTVGARMEILEKKEERPIEILVYAGADRDVLMSMSSTSFNQLWVDYVDKFLPKGDNEGDAKKN